MQELSCTNRLCLVVLQLVFMNFVAPFKQYYSIIESLKALSGIDMCGTWERSFDVIKAVSSLHWGFVMDLWRRCL